MWFPRPHAPSSLVLPPVFTESSVQALYDLLTAPDAVEHRDKVGVGTAQDGSSKPTTRLLESRGWFFRTSTHDKTPNQTALLVQMRPLLDLRRREVVPWHPAKLWFGLEHDGSWYLVSGSPVLTTIRQLEDWSARRQSWTDMLLLGLRVSRQHKVGLDLNPSNFGFQGERRRELYYLDDETYGEHTLQDFADVVVSRLPEHGEIGSQEWEEWGRLLQRALLPHLHGLADWRQFQEGLQNYPLGRSLEEKRDALLKGLVQNNPYLDPEVRRRKRKRKQARKICVFSDVHANLPALESVLAEAKKLEVDGYLFLGDAVGYGPFPKECIQRLSALDNCVCLRGNHDQMIATGEIGEGVNRLAREVAQWSYDQLDEAERDWLLAQPPMHREDPWLAVHGAPQDPSYMFAYIYELTYLDNLNYLVKHNIPVCFYGHTHVQFVYKLAADGGQEKFAPESLKLFQPGETLLINPGAVGQPRDRDPRAAFVLWDRDTETLDFLRVEYDVERAIRALHEANLPEDLAHRLDLGW